MRIIVVTLFLILGAAPAWAHAPQGRGPFECDKFYYQHHQCQPMRPAQWRKVEATNGQRTYIDMASIKYRRGYVPPFYAHHVGRIAQALIYNDDGMPIGGENAGWYDFDCDAPYLLGEAGVVPYGPAQFLPSHSIGNEVREIACGASN